jgi:hypothetical protein
MNDQEVETEVQAKGLATAPRVKPDQIDALMERVSYIGGRVEQTTSTVVHAFLDGSFLLATGYSACVSPENFNAELGFKMARDEAADRAREQLWLLEGYALSKSLAAALPDYRDRVRLERGSRADELDKLRAFVRTPTFDALPLQAKTLLLEQEGAMQVLVDVLDRRIATFGD